MSKNGARKKGKRYTDAEIELIKHLLDEGVSKEEIVRKTGRTSGSIRGVINRLRLSRKDSINFKALKAAGDDSFEATVLKEYAYGMKVKDIAKKHGVGRGRVSAVLWKHRVSSRGRHIRKRIRDITPEIEARLQKGESALSICRRYNLCTRTLTGIKIRMGLKIKNAGTGDKWEVDDILKLISLYNSGIHNRDDLASKMGDRTALSINQILTRLKEEGAIRLKSPVKRPEWTEEQISSIRKMFESGMSATAVAKRTGIAVWTAESLAERLGIPWYVNRKTAREKKWIRIIDEKGILEKFKELKGKMSYARIAKTLGVIIPIIQFVSSNLEMLEARDEKKGR